MRLPGGAPFAHAVRGGVSRRRHLNESCTPGGPSGDSGARGTNGPLPRRIALVGCSASEDGSEQTGSQMTTTQAGALTDAEARTLDSYWRGGHYLSVGQIYLLDNQLLTEPLRPEHIKPRLLGHWGTSPGLNLIWAHLKRAITVHNQAMMFVIGPGHGGPAALANTWLDGSYSEVYPGVPRDAAGMGTLFRQFSFPCGVPS